MPAKEEWSDRRFGRLTVIIYIGGSSKKPSACLVECDCGRTKLVLWSNLLGGNSNSCGCLKREWASGLRIINRKRPFEWCYNHFLIAAAKGDKHTVELSYEDFFKFTDIKICHYCYSDIVWHPYSVHNKAIGYRRYNLDRKNNNLGYTVENCVVCCKRCNIAKGAYFTYEEWWGMTEYFRRKYEDQREYNDIGGITEGTGIESTGASD